MVVSLEQVKQHLLIETDIDDLYLLDLITVAEDAVLRANNVRNYEYLTGIDGLVYPSVIQSILILIGTLYNNRESVKSGNVVKVPHTFDYLMSLNKNYNDCEGRHW